MLLNVISVLPNAGLKRFRIDCKQPTHYCGGSCDSVPALAELPGVAKSRIMDASRRRF